MRVAIASDLHLEFAPVHLENTENAEVLILAGDICTAVEFTRDDKEGSEFKEFFDNVCRQFPHVVYVMGNHEHYHYDLAFTKQTLMDALPYLNLHILENDTFEYGGYVFVGATLWTDYNRECPITIEECKVKMNEFKIINNSDSMVSYRTYPKAGEVKFKDRPSQFRPAMALEFHKKSRKFIELCTENSNRKYVIITHHSPTPFNLSEEFSWDYYGNGAFASNLDEFILNSPQIKLWVSGHIHTCNDYMMGNTRMVVNPRGYKGYEQRAREFELKYIEL